MHAATALADPLVGLPHQYLPRRDISDYDSFGSFSTAAVEEMAGGPALMACYVWRAFSA